MAEDFLDRLERWIGSGVDTVDRYADKLDSGFMGALQRAKKVQRLQRIGEAITGADLGAEKLRARIEKAESGRAQALQDQALRESAAGMIQSPVPPGEPYYLGSSGSGTTRVPTAVSSPEPREQVPVQRRTRPKRKKGKRRQGSSGLEEGET